MTEYISRDSALAFQCEVEPVMCKSVTTGKVFSATPDTALVKFLNALPAADVRENKRGEWIVLDECSNEGIYCSKCHTKIFDFTHKPKKKLSNFCPNCGADMREEQT